MVVYRKPQQRKKEESERLRGERDQIKFIALRFERWRVVRFSKQEGEMFINCKITLKMEASKLIIMTKYPVLFFQQQLEPNLPTRLSNSLSYLVFSSPFPQKKG